MTRHIAFDTETTGLDPKAGHRIVEIGCVEMIDYIRTDNVFHAYLNPERDMPPEAQKVHGLSSDFLADKPLFKDIAQDFLAFVGEDVLVAHNAGFDMKFINHELVIHGFPAFAANRSIDTLQLARQKYPGQPASLDALCRRFDVDLSARTLHGALLDAQLLADVYLELMGGRQTSLLSDKPTIRQDSITMQDIKHRTAFPYRHFPASEEEKAAHDAFMKRFK
jgi:DNA polymerase-3 subunit epsilon